MASENLGDLPRPLRVMVESSQLFWEYLSRANGDAVQAGAAALNDGCVRAERMAALAAPFDAFDVLESVRMSQIPLDAETYKETEHEGSAAVIELAALVLAARGTREGTIRPALDDRRPRPDATMDEIIAELRTAVDAGSMVPAFEAVAAAGSAGALQLGALIREIHVRNLSYTHMVEDTLTGLFSDPTIESDCRAVMGCTVTEIRGVFDAFASIYAIEWNRRFDILRELSAVASDEMTKAAVLEAVGESYTISPEAKTRGIALLEDAWTNTGDASSVDVGVVAKHRGHRFPRRCTSSRSVQHRDDATRASRRGRVISSRAGRRSALLLSCTTRRGTQSSFTMGC